MGNKIRSLEAGILHSTFTGDIDMAAIDQFVNNVAPHMSDNTALHFVVDAAQEGRWSFEARRRFTEMFDNEPRYGKVAIVNASRFTQVAATFMMKATGRHDSVRFFGSEAEALNWLRE